MTGAVQLEALLARRQPDLVVIGGSAGGVNALLKLLPALSPRMRASVVCILHVPGDRDSHLAELFNGRIALPVREARDKEPLTSGTVYFAGSGYHLSIEDDQTFSLSNEALVNYSRPSIDILMESAADAYGPSMMGILLTGANSDGAQGMLRIHEAGGLTVVQDPQDAQQTAMPLEALRRFQPDLVLPLAGIGELLSLLEDA